MLGVTSASEDRAKTLDWVKNMGVTYPFAFAADRKLHEVAGVKGIPHAALFNAEGVMVWSGSPYSLNKGTIKEALRGASKKMTFGWGKPYAGVAKSLLAGDFGKAIKDADALLTKGTEGAEEVKSSLLSKLDKRIAAMEKALKAGDYYAALVIAENLDGSLKGLDQQTVVTATLETLSGDEAKTVLGGQKKLAKIKGSKLKKTRDIEAAIKQAKRLAEKYQGTLVATQANDFVQAMRKRKSAKH